MYITNTTENVRVLFDELLKQNDNTKLKTLIYILNSLYNNQINDKDNPNSTLYDEDIKIFNFDLIGLENEWIYGLNSYLLALYRMLNKGIKTYVDDGNVIGIEYNTIEKKLLSSFGKLSYNEKLDVLSELFIRYDNYTYSSKKITIVKISDNISGFDIAKRIQDTKK